MAGYYVAAWQCHARMATCACRPCNLAAQVDTFQYSCLTPKDQSTGKYTNFVTVLYADSMNSTLSNLQCPGSQYLVINSVGSACCAYQ